MKDIKGFEQNVFSSLSALFLIIWWLWIFAMRIFPGIIKQSSIILYIVLLSLFLSLIGLAADHGKKFKHIVLVLVVASLFLGLIFIKFVLLGGEVITYP